jgi:hypothetical protein
MFASDLVGRTIVAAVDDYHGRMLLRLDNGVVVEIGAEGDEDGADLNVNEFKLDRDWAAWSGNDLKVVLSPEDYAKAKQWREEQDAARMAEAERKERLQYEMLKQKFGG